MTFTSTRFLLIELLVVVAIIGILASVGVVGYQRYIDSTKLTLLRQMVSQSLTLGYSYWYCSSGWYFT